MSRRTVAEDDKSQEGQVALSLYGVPAEVRVTLSNQHGAALKAASCQVCHHLRTNNSASLLGIVMAHSVFLTLAVIGSASLKALAELAHPVSFCNFTEKTWVA